MEDSYFIGLDSLTKMEDASMLIGLGRDITNNVAAWYANEWYTMYILEENDKFRKISECVVKLVSRKGDLYVSSFSYYFSEQNSLVTSNGFTVFAFAEVLKHFPCGYSPSAFLQYCANITCVAAKLYELFFDLEYFVKASNVISAVLIGYFMSGQFQNYGHLAQLESEAEQMHRELQEAQEKALQQQKSHPVQDQGHFAQLVSEAEQRHRELREAQEKALQQQKSNPVQDHGHFAQLVSEAEQRHRELREAQGKALLQQKSHPVQDHGHLAQLVLEAEQMHRELQETQEKALQQQKSHPNF